MKLRGGVSGSTLTYQFPIVTSSGDPFDLTNYTLRFTIKRSVQDSLAAAVFVGTLANGGIGYAYTAQDGVVIVTIPSTVTATMRVVRPYFWDLQLVSGIAPNQAKVYVPFHGTMSVLAPVSFNISSDS
jgi:hypothetical protein